MAESATNYLLWLAVLLALLDPWRKHYVPLKHHEPLTQQGLISQKIWILNYTTMQTSNLAENYLCMDNWKNPCFQLDCQLSHTHTHTHTQMHTHLNFARASLRLAISAACIASAISSSSWHSELKEEVSLLILQLKPDSKYASISSNLNNKNLQKIHCYWCICILYP